MTDCADKEMLELFLQEAAAQAADLESGLLSLESGQGRENLSSLMRAAHSIKGAARIVGLTTAVSLAHAMEDVFCAARDKGFALMPDSVDLLLQGVDAFARMSRETPDSLCPYLDQEKDAIAGLKGRLEKIPDSPAGGAAPPPGPEPPRPIPPPPAEAAPAAPPEPARQTSPEPAKPAAPEDQAAASRQEASVLVTAKNLTRIMALSGQCLVEALSLKTLLGRMSTLKQESAQVSRVLENLAREVAANEGFPSRKSVSSFLGLVDKIERCRESLAAETDFLETAATSWENLAEKLYNEAIAARMRPFKDGIAGFSRMVRDIGRTSGKKLELIIAGENTPVDRDILAGLEAPLTHLLRNACDHGIGAPQERIAAGKPEKGVIRLSAGHRAGMLHISVEDDGRGIDPERIRESVVRKGLIDPATARKLSPAELLEFLFLPGFSTAQNVTELSGRGVGLDVVRTMVAGVGGTVNVESSPGAGARFFLKLPLTLSVLRTLVVELCGEPYAFSLNKVERVLTLHRKDVQVAQDRPYVTVSGETLGLVSGRQVLSLPESAFSDELSVVVIAGPAGRHGIVVDRFLGEKSLVVQPLFRNLGKLPNVMGGAVADDGNPVLILDVEDLLRSIEKTFSEEKPLDLRDQIRAASPKAKRRLLVVDDSLTVRETERRLLSSRGYEVSVAVDGVDGLNAVKSSRYDLVITDVDMPRMDGIELVRAIRADPSLRGMPIVIMSYKDRESDRMAGLAAGADRYLTKAGFEDESFLAAVSDLIGE
ncbi:MAG: hybrid sensor histidine kinase/response regulator [Thermodesulfobacteriota bacterium]